jgi:intracellular septation protein
MQPLIDLVPLVAFLLAYYLGGIYVATLVLMASMAALVLLDLVRQRRVSPMHLISTVLVLLLGSATLILRDPRFLKWKPTIFLWLIALTSLGSTWIGKAPLSQRLLGQVVPGSEALPRSIWLRLNWIWTLFYAGLGALNLWVAFSMSERFWVNFKVIGLTVAFVIFAMVQALWLSSRVETQAAGTA